MKQVALSYLAATASSITVALGTGKLAKTFLSPSVQRAVLPMVPFFAVSCASVLNVFLMRRNEIYEGITVKDEFGREYGKSKVAGTEAVKLTAISRVVWSIPVLSFPPIILALLNRTKWFRANPRLELPVNLSLITVALFFGVPAAIGLFPDTMEIQSSHLEPQFQQLLDQSNRPISKFYYYRGL